MRFKNGLLLYNHHAGKKAVPISQQVMKTVSESVEYIEKRIISAPGEGEKICFHLGDRYDIVIIYGGDGTVHDCVNGIARLEKRPIIAVLPGGTCNDFSRSIGVPVDLKAACRLLKTGVVRKVDLGAMNDRYFVNFWGIGMITETSENIDEKKKSAIGKVSYYLSALEVFRNPSYFHYMIEADGEILEGNAVMVIALNGNFIGTVELPFQASHEDGFLDLIIVKKAGFSLVKEMIHTKTLQVTDEQKANLEHRRVKLFTVHTGNPMRIDMDGEVYASTPAVCKVKPGYIRFISAI